MLTNSPFSPKTMKENSSMERIQTGIFTPRKVKNDLTRYLNAKFLTNPASDRKSLPSAFPTDPRLLKEFDNRLFPSIKEVPRKITRVPTKRFDSLKPWFQYMKKKYLDCTYASEETKRNIISFAISHLIDDIKQDSEEKSELLKSVIESYSLLWTNILKKKSLYHTQEVKELQSELETKKKRLESFLTHSEMQYNRETHPVYSLLSSISKVNIRVQELNNTPNKKEISSVLNALYLRLPGTIGREFSEIVYEDFVNASQVKYSEMKFRSFVIGCLKYPSVKRINNFLRVMKLGHLCSTTNFSKFSCDFYLKCNLIATKSKIDIKTAKKCLKLAKNFLIPEKYDSYLKNSAGIVDREAFLTSLVEIYENTQKDIHANVVGIHSVLTYENERNYFTIEEVHGILKNLCMHKLGKHYFNDSVVLNDFIEFSTQKSILTNYDIDRFLDKFAEFDKKQARKFMQFETNNQGSSNQTLAGIIESTKCVSPKFSMLCWLIFKPNADKTQQLSQ